MRSARKSGGSPASSHAAGGAGVAHLDGGAEADGIGQLGTGVPGEGGEHDDDADGREPVLGSLGTGAAGNHRRSLNMSRQKLR